MTQEGFSMRQLCPLRPLTEAGRVLVCIAASLFAALLLVAWTAVPSDDIEPAQPLTSASSSSVMRGL
jgi:hypothetical protein